MLLDVVNVKPMEGFRLLLLFENGEQRCMDMGKYLEQKPWNRLKTKGVFMAASVENGTVVWPGNIDIDSETLYECSLSIK
ncbi:uncharacterized protein DUF2442 [Desulfobotulus alkaliphilus]|uniref:Uncharacterized protein DUF2442 n=1 Tax=Desulfobotulus alkaliphilus TaxID=622671 RepID=A0A562RT67_9BACT|nr:DUF2442 domain-containing protein [Desulfobotulus alkaliphilus]TWI72271.1 uncharacterized protein DUF2442 [Desulfobotulus alkaliphilus]